MVFPIKPRISSSDQYLRSIKVDFKLSMVYRGRVTQCAIYPWVHNFDEIKDCGKCKNFIKVVPLHPHLFLECRIREEDI